MLRIRQIQKSDILYVQSPEPLFPESHHRPGYSARSEYTSQPHIQVPARFCHGEAEGCPPDYPWVDWVYFYFYQHLYRNGMQGPAAHTRHWRHTPNTHSRVP